MFEINLDAISRILFFLNINSPSLIYLMIHLYNTHILNYIALKD